MMPNRQDNRSPPDRFAPRRLARAILVTLIALAALTLFVLSGVFIRQTTQRIVILVLLGIVVYAGSSGGVPAGLISAVACAAFYALIPFLIGGTLDLTRESTGRILLVGVAFVFVGIVVGYLRQRVNAALERERAAHRETEAALEDARTAAKWAGFLSHASRILSASLDYRATLRAIAHLAVPDIADWCTVSVVDEAGGHPRRIEVAATTPSKENLARELDRRYPLDPESDHPIYKVLRTGEAQLIRRLSDEDLKQSARDEEHFQILRDLGLRSAMVVPLLARGRTLGIISFVSSESGREYSESDLGRARELAHRAALAVDNARLYGQAQAANVAKSNFLAVMSHELRTPLNAIIGYTELMLAGVPDPLPEKFRSTVERIVASARQLLELIEEILTFARTEAGEVRVRVEDVDVSELTRKTAAIIAPSAVEKGLNLDVHPPADELMMRTDGGKVRQIVAALLSNAVKFTEHGFVELSAHRTDGEMLFTVRDTGQGIAPEDVATIFEPFRQVAEPSTREVGGTGLGLSMAQRLAHLLGGDISVESQPGEGSTFTLRLPVELPGDESRRAA